MANSKISALTSATTPLAGTEVLPVVQSSTTKQVSVANLTAGRAISAASLALTTPLSVANGGTGAASWTANGIVYASGTTTLTNGTALTFNGTNFGLGVTISTAWGGVGSAMQIGSYISLNSNSNLGAGDLSYNSIRTASDSYQYLATNNATRFQQRDGAFKWFTAPSGTAGTAITFTQSMILDASSNLTLNVGNLIVGTSGKGIDFSATPGTGTSELFKDYEEGTFTPVLTDGTNNVSAYYYQWGNYTKVGNRVLYDITISIQTKGSITGDIYITGLPFTSTGPSYPNSVTFYAAACKIFNTGTRDEMAAQVEPNSIKVSILKITGNGQAAVQAADVTPGSQIFVSGHYWTLS